jgi:ABC-type uncharacterized transport system permease subunit
MIGKVVSWVIAAIVIFGIYKFFNGDIGLALTTVGDFLWKIVSTGADWFSKILGSLFSG